jgi:anaerobic selenocysteine-containing dehydrogenase
MKLSRRCFLSFVVGGAAGSALTPLPWKLMDDVSIWSQNWPWTPIPADGEAAYAHTTCSLCPGGCGISVRKVDERAIKIEGRKGHPVNNGGICMLGLSGLQMLYSPARIKAPLKRVGERGQGHWQTISWAQAIDEAAAKLKQIRQAGHPQNVAVLTSGPDNSVNALLARFLNAYGSPNLLRMPSVADAQSAVLKMTQGTTGTLTQDVAQADFILSFGSALLDGYGSPVRMLRAVARLKEYNGMLVQVEPRLSNTAAKADIWLAANPGSEADLALAMAAVLIGRKRFNADFVAGHTEGFDAFARLVKENYAPEKVAAASGIDAETITKVALRFAAAAKPVALCGRGKGQTPGSLKEALAVNALNVLVGNINRAGGLWSLPARSYIQWPAPAMDEVAAAGVKTARLDGAGADKAFTGGSLNHRFFQAVKDGSAKVEALLVAEANPCYSLPDAGVVRDAIGKIPFVVSFSSFMDETAALADLILPNHLYLERLEDVPVSAMLDHSIVSLAQPVVKPLHDTRHLGSTVIALARGMGGAVGAAFPWPDYETCLHETLAAQWTELASQGYVRADGAASSFATATGKLVLMNADIAAICRAESPRPAGEEGTFPLLLLPYDSIRLSSHHVGGTPFMLKTVPDTVLKGNASLVDIHPDTAAKLGLRQGQSATLTTPVGEAAVRVNVCQELMPGVVAMVRGLGHTAYDAFLADKGVNVNALIGSVEDSASGLDAAWGIRARLVKA